MVIMPLAQAAFADESNLGWYLGFIIGFVVVTAVVVLVAPILSLAARIGRQARQINDSLEQSYQNTLPLAELRQTIDHVRVIISGLYRGRVGLGGG